ncbi:MAG: hypothetical protein U5R31_13035 [Acidimicrobiia bacterium]|nr:hypothetical protein [Acidimicrobiia bacterium]
MSDATVSPDDDHDLAARIATEAGTVLTTLRERLLDREGGRADPRRRGSRSPTT